jgi:hypothetical protein
MRKSTFVAVAVGCLLSGALAYVAGARAAQDEKKGRLVHVVLFKLKDDVAKDEAETLISDGYELLAKVPSVKQMHTGRPSKKEMARNSVEYDVGLYCEFDDPKGLAEYIQNPMHQQYVQKHREHWADVRIIDFDAR